MSAPRGIELSIAEGLRRPSIPVRPTTQSKPLFTVCLPDAWLPTSRPISAGVQTLHVNPPHSKFRQKRGCAKPLKALAEQLS